MMTTADLSDQTKGKSNGYFKKLLFKNSTFIHIFILKNLDWISSKNAAVNLSKLFRLPAL